jgi:hypothetical protein
LPLSWEPDCANWDGEICRLKYVLVAVTVADPVAAVVALEEEDVKNIVVDVGHPLVELDIDKTGAGAVATGASVTVVVTTKMLRVT